MNQSSLIRYPDITKWKSFLQFVRACTSDNFRETFDVGGVFLLMVGGSWGNDGHTLPLKLKAFSPNNYKNMLDPSGEPSLVLLSGGDLLKLVAHLQTAFYSFDHMALNTSTCALWGVSAKARVSIQVLRDCR